MPIVTVGTGDAPAAPGRPARERLVPGTNRSATPDRRPRSSGSDRGQSLIGTTAALVVFLTFLMFAVHLAVNLYANSTVTARAYDAATQVAGADIDHGDPGAVRAAMRSAEADVRAGLGGYSSRIREFDWSGTSADAVQLRLVVDNPSFLIFSSGGVGVETIDRTVRVRVERVR